MKLGIKIDGNKTGGHVQKERESQGARAHAGQSTWSAVRQVVWCAHG